MSLPRLWEIRRRCKFCGNYSPTTGGRAPGGKFKCAPCQVKL